MSSGPRLRQVALVAHDRARVSEELGRALGSGPPFHDPAVATFGLENSVFAVGDTFVEVVAPVEAGTTAGRYLERRGQGGYMAIFQMADLGEARRRVADLGVRVVWTVDLDDAAGTHLHPKDVPGAIVSLDRADPPGSWRWAGPAWTGQAPAHDGRGIAALTIAVDDPAVAGHRWAAVLGVPADEGAGPRGGAGGSGAGHTEGVVVRLTEAAQELRFVPAGSGRVEGITEVTITGLAGPGERIAGVDFVGTGRGGPGRAQ